MQDLIEYLSQEQLVNIIILLEDDKKLGWCFKKYAGVKQIRY
ncbi:hypothetical protein [Acinetobacter lwoffii]|nr:hypothetical protein [Acinetobacter lwoffii]